MLNEASCMCWSFSYGNPSQRDGGVKKSFQERHRRKSSRHVDCLSADACMHDHLALTGCCLNSLRALFCVVKDKAKCPGVFYFLVAASLMCEGALVMYQCKGFVYFGECK